MFLDPKNQDEYALARKEIKMGPGHQDFEFIFDPSITLEEDLYRRDFTVNALCMKEDGEVIDCFHGLDDLQKKILRHISPHFVEDPLRVFRAAKFAARLDFSIAPETIELMKSMVKNGALEHVSAERIKLEFDDALQSDHFDTFVDVLKEIECWGKFSMDFPKPSALNKIKRLEHKWIYSGAISYSYNDKAETKEKNILLWKNKYRLYNRLEQLAQQLRYFFYLVENNLFYTEQVFTMLSYFQDGKNSKMINEFNEVINDLLSVQDLSHQWGEFNLILNHFKKLDWSNGVADSQQVKNIKMDWLKKI